MALCLQIISQLPEQVALTALSRDNASLLECITFLPASLHALALRAQHPSLAQHSSLALDAVPDSIVRFSPPYIRGNVLAAITGLRCHCTALSLPGCWLLDRNAPLHYLTQALTALSGLRSLEFQEGLPGKVASALVGAIAARGLTRLQRLAILHKPTRGLNRVMRSIVHLPALQSLCITDVKHDIREVLVFCNALQKLTALTSLSLIKCFVRKNGDLQVNKEKREEAIQHATYASVGPLLSTPASDEYEAMLAEEELVGECAQRMTVSLSLARALEHLQRLKHMGLTQSFAYDFLEPLLKGLECHGKQLTYLSFARAATMELLRAPHDFMLLKHYPDGLCLAPALCAMQGLVHLDLSWYGLNGDVANDAMAAIGGLTALTELNLEQLAGDMAHSSCRKPSEMFWEPFAEHVVSLVSLQQLTISSNESIKDTHAGRITHALAGLPRLAAVRMSGCKVRAAGAEAVAEAVTGMRALTLLDLRHNRIGPGGAKALAQSVRELPALRKLLLTHSCIGAHPSPDSACILSSLLIRWCPASSVACCRRECCCCVCPYQKLLHLVGVRNLLRTSEACVWWFWLLCDRSAAPHSLQSSCCYRACPSCAVVRMGCMRAGQEHQQQVIDDLAECFGSDWGRRVHCDVRVDDEGDDASWDGDSELAESGAAETEFASIMNTDDEYMDLDWEGAAENNGKDAECDSAIEIGGACGELGCEEFANPCSAKLVEMDTSDGPEQFSSSDVCVRRGGSSYLVEGVSSSTAEGSSAASTGMCRPSAGFR